MEFQKREPIIILIGGKARSGKSTVSKYMEKEYIRQGVKVVVSPYTKYLKYYIEEIMGMKITEDNKPREMLQRISSDLIKGKLGDKDFFIRRQIEDISLFSYFVDVILVPDVRFPREIEEIRVRFSNVISIGVVRSHYDSDLTELQRQDATEVSLDDYQGFDYRIENTEEDKLYLDTLEVIKKIEERRRVYE